MPGTRGVKSSASNPITRADPKSLGAVNVIASKVAAAITESDVATGVGVEMILNSLGETIGAAAFGLSPKDLHNSGDEPIFMTTSPAMVGELIQRVLNRAQERQIPIVPEHDAITALRTQISGVERPGVQAPQGAACSSNRYGHGRTRRSRASRRNRRRVRRKT